jgi:hypothetical protein
MANLKDKIEVEYENIDKLIREFPTPANCPFSNFYNYTTFYLK